MSWWTKIRDTVEKPFEQVGHQVKRTMQQPFWRTLVNTGLAFAGPYGLAISAGLGYLTGNGGFRSRFQNSWHGAVQTGAALATMYAGQAISGAISGATSTGGQTLDGITTAAAPEDSILSQAPTALAQAPGEAGLPTSSLLSNTAGASGALTDTSAAANIAANGIPSDASSLLTPPVGAAPTPSSLAAGSGGLDTSAVSTGFTPTLPTTALNTPTAFSGLGTAGSAFGSGTGLDSTAGMLSSTTAGGGGTFAPVQNLFSQASNYMEAHPLLTVLGAQAIKSIFNSSSLARNQSPGFFGADRYGNGRLLNPAAAYGGHT